jgi:glutamate synthase (NADPH/NADH) small chain
MALDQVVDQVAQLGSSPGVTAFQEQLKLLERQLVAEPRVFRDMFIAQGMAAVAAEFRTGQPLSRQFTHRLWQILLRDDDASAALMRFLWRLPVGRKRRFIQGLDEHLQERYPLFKDLSVGWPASTGIPPHIREPRQRDQDFDLVNTGYLGYLDLGYSLREVELLVWLEALRDKQCAESPCELGVLLHRKDGVEERKGGCPVQIHIPRMFELIGTGHFAEALAMLESCNPLPDVTGRVCPQELQCQGVCLHKHAMSIGQLEWFLPEWDKRVNPGADAVRLADWPNPWQVAAKPPVAVVGSGPSGLISAYLLAREGFPVTVFEAFHALGGVLRYGIPEFRLPNQLIDDVVAKIKLLGGRFVTNFVVGKTASLADLRQAGFEAVFVGSGAGLPQFLNVPGEHFLNVMSANEFLTRVNLMRAHDPDYETPLPEVAGRQVLVVGGGNTAMDAARTARRLGGQVTIVYRRTQAEMPARVEELEHALEEGVGLAQLRSPVEFLGDHETGFVTAARLDVMALGEPDQSGRRRPVATGRQEEIPADLVVMALGNSANPIIKDSEPALRVSGRGAIELRQPGSQQTSLDAVYSGGDAARGGSTAIRAAGDGQAAAREILRQLDASPEQVAEQVAGALRYSERAAAAPVIVAKRHLSSGIEEFTVRAPAIAAAARAGQFVRVLPTEKGELIPLTLADWDVSAGTVTLAVQGMGASSLGINQMEPGQAFAGIAGPLGQPSQLHRYDAAATVVFTAGGLGLPPVHPIMREHLRLGNHVTLISGFRNQELMFWVGPGERVPQLQAEFGDQLEVVYATDDGSFGVHGFVTTALQPMLEAAQAGTGRPIAEVVTIGPPLMMRAVTELTRGYGVKTVASLNSIMVDATGMCGACMVPVLVDGKLVRKHACIDGPEIDAHSIDWDKFLPRFRLFRAQETEARRRHGLI